ncbi:MAG: hypothetical protein VX438_19795, partial [Planctomycetota bacterium]|nr:hypothetical protein [Planctomycetota bacterium]
MESHSGPKCHRIWLAPSQIELGQLADLVKETGKPVQGNPPKQDTATQDYTAKTAEPVFLKNHPVRFPTISQSQGLRSVALSF